MIDEHICDGDIALIENRTEAHDGEIVVARLVDEDRATLKKLYRRGANVELCPASSHHEPLTLPADQVAIQASSAGSCVERPKSCYSYSYTPTQVSHLNHLHLLKGNFV